MVGTIILFTIILILGIGYDIWRIKNAKKIDNYYRKGYTVQLKYKRSGKVSRPLERSGLLYRRLYRFLLPGKRGVTYHQTKAAFSLMITVYFIITLVFIMVPLYFCLRSDTAAQTCTNFFTSIWEFINRS